MARGFNDEKDGDEGFVLSDEATIVASREKAIQVDLGRGRHDFIESPLWIPTSQVHPNSEVHDPSVMARGQLVVTTFLARERGWLDGEDEKRGKPLLPAPAPFTSAERAEIRALREKNRSLSMSQAMEKVRAKRK